MTIQLKPKTRAFWESGEKKPQINLYELRNFLELYGFGQFATTNNRTSQKELFYNDDGILKIHNSSTIKMWLREFIESVPEKQFRKDGVFDTTNPSEPSTEKFKVLGMVQNLSSQILKQKYSMTFKYFQY